MENNIITLYLKKWGNSSGIRIPKNILDQIGLKDGDPLELFCEEDRIVIKKASRKKYKNLKERFEAFYGMPFEEIPVESTQEELWGSPIGKELW